MYTLTKRRERYHPEDTRLRSDPSYPNHLNPFGSQDDDTEDLNGALAADRPISVEGGGPTGEIGPLGASGGFAQEGEPCPVASHMNKPSHIKYEFRSPRPSTASWLDRAPTPPPPVSASAPPVQTSPTTPNEPPSALPLKKPVPTPRSSHSTSTTSPTKPPKPPPPLMSPVKTSPDSSPSTTSPTRVPPPRPPPPSVASLTASCSSFSSSSSLTQQIPQQSHATVPRTPPRQRRYQHKGQLGSTRSLQSQTKTTHHLGTENSTLARSEGHIEGIQPHLGSAGSTSPTEESFKPLGVANGDTAGSTLSLQYYNGSSTLYSGSKAASTQSLHGPSSSSCVPVPARRSSLGGSMERGVSLRPRRPSREAYRPPTEQEEGQGQSRLSPRAQSQELTTRAEDTTLSISRLRVTLVNGNTGEEDVEESRKMNGIDPVEDPVTRMPCQEDNTLGQEVAVEGEVLEKAASGVVLEKVEQVSNPEKTAREVSSENVAEDSSPENQTEEAPPEGLVVNGIREKVLGERDHTQGETVQELDKNTGEDVNELEATNDHPPFELLQIIEPGDELKKSEPGVPEVAVDEVTSSISEECDQKVENKLEVSGEVTEREAKEDLATKSPEEEEVKLAKDQMEESSNLDSEVKTTENKDGDGTEIKDKEKMVKSVGILGVQVLPKDVIAEAMLRAHTPRPSTPKKEYNPFDEDTPEETVNEVSVLGTSRKEELPQPRTSSPRLPSSSPRLPTSHPVSTNPFDEDDDEDDNLKSPALPKTSVQCPPTPPPPKSAVKNVNLDSTNPFEEDMSDEETPVAVTQPLGRKTPSSSSTLAASTSTVSLSGSAVTSYTTPQSSPSQPFPRGEGGRMSLAVRGSGMMYRGDSRTSLPPRSRKKRPAPQPPGPRPSFAQLQRVSPSPSGGTQVSEARVTSPLSPTTTKEQLPPSDPAQESPASNCLEKSEALATVSIPAVTRSPEGSPAREMKTQEERASLRETSPEVSPVHQSSPKTSAVRKLEFRTSPVRESSPKPSLIRESGPKGSPGRDSSPKTRLIQGPDPMASPIRQLRSDSSPIRELSPRSSPFREPSPITSPRPESYPSGSSKSSPVRDMTPQINGSQGSSPRVSPVRQGSPSNVNEGQTERPVPPEDSPVWRRYTDASSANQKVPPEESPVWKRSPEVAGRHKTPEGSPRKRTSNGQVDRHSSPVSLGERKSPETFDSSEQPSSPSKGVHSSSKTATLRNLPPSKWFGSLSRSFQKKLKKNKESAKDANS